MTKKFEVRVSRYNQIREKNLPEKYHQARYYISQLNNRSRLHDISIVKNKEGTFLSIFYTDVNDADALLQYLEQVFGKITIVS